MQKVCTRMAVFISLKNIVPRMPDSPFIEPLNWEIKDDEIWTVLGPNGSGKSLLGEIICGRYGLNSGEISYPFMDEMRKQQPGTFIWPKQFIHTVHFNAAYSLADFREMYYQQRFNSTEAEASPLVSDLFPVAELPSGLWETITSLLPVEQLMQKRLIHLSSGELRRTLIAQSLLRQPRMLIFDNPFIGLDVEARDHLNEAFLRLHQSGIRLLFLVPSAKDVPACTTHVLSMENCRIKAVISPEAVHEPTTEISLPAIEWDTTENKRENYSEVVGMNGLTMQYGEKVIASGIDWHILKGEKWALLGPNGSGKSTLLSFIFADHPQAYSQPLTLFDRKRGSGESIWDIKRRIGYTSSEMHLYYRENVSCFEVVASGFFDSIGLFRRCNDRQTEIVDQWFAALGLNALRERSFLRISSGEQRLMLFMRAFIKNPELVILDEPFHGLDARWKTICTGIIESFCRQPDKSLIFVTHRHEEIPASVSRFFELKK